MKSIASISDLAENVSGYIKKAEADGVVPISRSGQTVAFLVSREKMAGLLETMELQADADLMDVIRKHKAGTLRLSPLPNEL